MSVDEMLMITRLFLGGMIFFLLLSVVLFFRLEIQKAWSIVTGAKTTGYAAKQAKRTGNLSQQSRENKKNESATVVLQQVQEKFDVTTVLEEANAQTMVLKELSPEENLFELVLDITYIHTEIII